MSLNKVLLIGNVGQDPKINVKKDGGKIASLSLATSERWQDKATKETKEKTEWHRVVILSEGLVGIIEKYVKKGSKLYIEGTLQTRKWTDKDGVERYATEIVLQGYNNKLEIMNSQSPTQKNNQDVDDGGYSGGDNAYNDVSIDDEVPF